MADEVTSQPGGTGTEASGNGEQQSENRAAPGFEPSEDEKKVVQQWLERVQRAEDKPETKAWRDALEKLRGYVAGTVHGDASGKDLVRTNMVFATIAAQIPELYARNPQIAVEPTDAVPEQQLQMVKKFAATAEKAIRKVLVEEGKLKKRMKANIRSACTTAFGVLKVLYQHEYRGDPIAVRRMQDTQDNLAKVEGLIRQMKKTDDPSDLARQRDELKANLKALAAGNEVKIYKGFTVDRVKSEDFLILDESIVEFDEYEDARALGHLIWKTVGEAKVLFDGVDLTGARKYARPRVGAEGQSGAPATPSSTPSDEMFICVVEIWDKENGVIRTTAKGMNRWLSDPYPPEHAPERWYGFYVTGYNVLEGRWRPISDVELLMGLQEEYSTTRTNYAEIRKKATPKTIVRKSGQLTEEDVNKLMTQGTNDVIAIEGSPTVPISQDVVRLEGPKIDPQAYDVSQIRNDMDLVVGRSDASRANLIKPKTATEAEIMQQAMQTRMGERRDSNEDLMSDMGEATLQTMLRCFSKKEIEQLCGGDAEWPDTPQGADEVFRLVSVRVRAGSSGKPNAMQEREQWKELLPVLSDAIGKVVEYRAAGNYELADATLELVRETLHRYDENIDLDAIIPPIKKGPDGKPVAEAQAAQQLLQTRQALQECQQELQDTQQKLAKAQSGEAAKVRQVEVDAARQAEEERRNVEQQQLEANREQERALAEEETKRQQAQVEDARAKREMDAKGETEIKVAEINAASRVEVARIQADAQEVIPAPGGEEADGTPKKGVTRSAARDVIGELKALIAGLDSSMQALAKDSSERTQLVKQHLASTPPA